MFLFSDVPNIEISISCLYPAVIIICNLWTINHEKYSELPTHYISHEDIIAWQMYWPDITDIRFGQCPSIFLMFAWMNGLPTLQVFLMLSWWENNSLCSCPLVLQVTLTLVSVPVKSVLPIVCDLGVIFEGHLAPLPKQFSTSPQVTYISSWLCVSMILWRPYKDIFMPLKFVWGGGALFSKSSGPTKIRS